MDKIRNEYIKGTAQVGGFGEKTREARLRWYGHTCTDESASIQSLIDLSKWGQFRRWKQICIHDDPE